MRGTPNGAGDDISAKAMQALRGDDPDLASRTLRKLLTEAPERIDLLHALAVTELRRSNASEAWQITMHAQQIAESRRDATAGTVMPQIVLVRAAACEDLHDAAGAEAAYRLLLEHEPVNPRGTQGLGYMLVAVGRTQDGLAMLDQYITDKQDEPQYIEATQAFVDSLRQLIANDIHPREFLAAHRGSYVEMFDHYASEMEAKGWMAEAARMQRDDSGNVVPIIPEGARDYASVRVDLVDPNTGQPGRVGEQPMVVSLAEYQPLARAPVVTAYPERDWPFQVWTSSQVPWNDLSVQVRFVDPNADAVATFDPVLGDWYRDGFDGKYGSAQHGRFHEVSDISANGPGCAHVTLDAGRAELSCIDGLLRRLTILHGQHPIAHVLFGRGFLPA
jgi:Flp pilus assembly protein TadD